MPIERKYERDVDLLLAEEFAVNPRFAARFLERTGFAGREAPVVDWFVSRSDADGESDVIVVFEEAGAPGRIALLIEDKVDANLQPTQAERYRIRAESDRAAGLYDRFETVLCAPAAYVDARPGLSGFDRVVTFEEVARMLRLDNDPRSDYRAAFLETAATRRVNAWTRRDDPVTNAFWAAAYDVAAREFVELEMRPPNLTKGSSWINYRPADMPTKPCRTYVSFKGDKGFMDLTIEKTAVHRMQPLLAGLLEPDMTMHQTGQATAVRISVAPIVVADGFEAQEGRVRAAFAASVRLIRFYREHRAAIDAAAAAARAPG